jgi:hypothetical protein
MKFEVGMKVIVVDNQNNHRWKIGEVLIIDKLGRIEIRARATRPDGTMCGGPWVSDKCVVPYEKVELEEVL